MDGCVQARLLLPLRLSYGEQVDMQPLWSAMTQPVATGATCEKAGRIPIVNKGSGYVGK